MLRAGYPTLLLILFPIFLRGGGGTIFQCSDQLKELSLPSKSNFEYIKMSYIYLCITFMKTSHPLKSRSSKALETWISWKVLYQQNLWQKKTFQQNRCSLITFKNIEINLTSLKTFSSTYSCTYTTYNLQLLTCQCLHSKHDDVV